MASVDVVVPCYNYAHFLPSCVNSVLTQAGVDVRVLVIDDCSGDDSALVGERLAAADARVHFRRHAQNRGHIATYNEGLLEWASADYSLLLSADDLLVPGALGRATALLDANPQLGFAYGAALFFGDESQIELPRGYDVLEHRIIDSERFLEFCCVAGNPVPTPTALVRTRLQHKVGGYRPTLPHAGDLEMWMRFANQAPVGALRAVQALYRWHGANMSRTYFGRMLSERRQQIAACVSALAEHGSLPAAPAWLARQRQRMANEALHWAGSALEDGDTARVSDCVAFAREFAPTLLGSQSWWRFRAKSLLGRRLLNNTRTALNRLRRIEGAPRTALSAFDSIRPGSRTGWWPAV